MMWNEIAVCLLLLVSASVRSFNSSFNVFVHFKFTGMQHICNLTCTEHLLGILKSFLSMENMWLTASETRFDMGDKWCAVQPSEASHITVQYFWFYTTCRINSLALNLPWNELRAPTEPDLNTVWQNLLLVDQWLHIIPLAHIPLIETTIYIFFPLT